MQLFKQNAGEKEFQEFQRKNRYRLMGSVGHGRTCEVYTSFDTGLNRIVAVKKLAKSHARNPVVARSFSNETRLVSYLDHPGVITLFDTFLDEDACPCYAMKLVEGETLRGQFANFPHNRKLQIFTKLCETMAYVHDRGVVHLDLTPDNILLSNYGEVVITGWSNGRLYDKRPYEAYLRLVREAPKESMLDISNVAPGSSEYQSPEQVRGAVDDLGPESDVFSLGSILYEMMTGNPPFRSSDTHELANLICDYDPAPMVAVNSEIPQQLQQICSRMMAKDVFGRYHSFHELMHDLDIFYHSGQAFRSREYNQNDVIFREGDPGEFAFTVDAGEVAVVKMVDGNQTVLARLGKDQIVGELAIFTGELRTATVVAIQQGTAIRIMGRSDVEQELQKLSPWVGSMITGLSQRFNEMNAKLIALSRQVSGR